MWQLSFRRFGFYGVFLVGLLFNACGQAPENVGVSVAAASTPSSPVKHNVSPLPNPLEQKTYLPFERTEAAARIAEKISNGQPLVVHIMVPLCDNEHQGIVPVPTRLGNGLDPRQNLYWGALYGIKTHFRRSNKWQMVKSQTFPDSTVLERVIYSRKYANGAKVFLVADAYRGDRMRTCVYDVLGAAAGAIKDAIAVEEQKIGLYGEADLLVFNGHNGLMDFEPTYVYSQDERIREVAVIGCASYSYFKPYLLRARGYPVLTTSNLMAPEAYVVSGLVDAWAAGLPDANIRQAAGQAYHNYQKCGLRGATNLFYAGWQDME